MKQFAKKLTSLFMAACLLITAVIVALPITVSAATNVSSWTGITSASGNYILTGDITISDGQTFAETFTGTLDGNGHTITVADTMFAMLGGGATLKNFKVVASGTVDFTPIAYEVAAATSSNPIAIENVSVNVAIDTSAGVATDDGTVASFIATVPGVTTYIEMTNCVSLGKIDSDNQVGAFIGRTNATDMTAVLIDCVNHSDIYTTNSYAGGFIGMLDTSKHTVSFQRCINYGDVEATGSDAGGFLACASGSNNDVITFTDCANFGAITNHKTGSTDTKYNAGGFLPRVDNAASVTFTNCLSAASTYTCGTNFASYFCNYNAVGTVTRTNCYFVANLPSGYTSTESASTAGMTQVTAAQLASGEVAYKLNGSSQINPDWYQIIGTDTAPHHTASDNAIVRYDSAAGKYTNDYVYVVAPQFDIALEANYGTYSVYNFNTGENENFTGIKVDVYVNNINSSLTYGIAGIDGYLEFDGAALTPYYTTTEELNGISGSVNPGPIANFPTYSQTVSGVTFSLFSVEGLCTEYIAGSGSLRMNYIIDVDNHTAWKNSKTGITNADAVKLSYYFTVNSGATDGATYTFKVPANPDATTVEEATLRAPYYTGTTDQTAFGTVFGRAAEAECTITTSTTYTVKFLDYDNSIISTQTVAAGGSATPPTPPTREGYDFVNWQGSYTNVYADTDVIATYSIQTFTVKFIDYDETTISTQTVNYGGNATVPADPTRDGYTFTGWSGTYTNVKADSTVTAQYTQNTVAAEFFVFASGADTTYVSIDETNGYLVFKAGGMSASAIAALFNDTNISITKADGTTAVTGTALAGTTYIITSTINGESKSLTVVVKGDVNCDGKVIANDVARLNLHATAKNLLTNSVVLYAANVQGTAATVNAQDVSRLNLFAQNKIKNF